MGQTHTQQIAIAYALVCITDYSISILSQVENIKESKLFLKLSSQKKIIMVAWKTGLPHKR